MKRSKAWRRSQNKRIQKKRYKFWKSRQQEEINYFKTKNEKWWIDSPNNYGKLVKTHFGCGCKGCKPWKFKLDKKYKFSEYKNLYNFLDILSYD